MKSLLLILFCLCILHGWSQTLFSSGSSWKYFDQGQLPASGWQTNAYNDNSWPSGATEMGYGDGDEATVVSYGPSSSDKFPTTYFRKTFFVSNPAQFTQMVGSIRRDDGAVVYVNGVEVFRDNMPPGNINYNTLASSTVAFTAEDTYHTFYFSPALLTTGNNLIAVEIHQDDVTSSDISFNMSLTGSTTPISAYITREAYLNSAAETSVVVKWQTDIDCDARIMYGLTPSNLAFSASDYVYRKDHEVLITGLEPGTIYYYSVGTAGSELLPASTSQYFKTSPQTGSTGSYRFWAIGDAGMSDDNQRAVRDGFLSYNNNRHIDGWILLGDNAYGSGISDGTQSCYQTAFFNGMYSAIISKTICWPATGNHDYNNHIPFSPSPAYFDIFSLPTSGEAGGLPSGTEKYYSWNYGNIHFIVLDSYDEDRSVNSPMLTWLVNDLSQNAADWIIAYWHHPPYTKGSHDSDNSNGLDGECVEIRENVLPILEQYGVDLVLNGHSHSYERTFFLDGHYGTSNTLSSSMILDSGTGGLNGQCPYQKNTILTKSHKGTVYAVVGCSGKLSSVSSSWPHPAMSQYSDSDMGSMVVDVTGNRLEAQFIGTDGTQKDQFTIIKNAGVSDSLTVCSGEPIELTASFPPPLTWLPGGETVQTITPEVMFNTLFIAQGENCISDTFFIQVDNSTGCVDGLEELNATAGMYFTEDVNGMIVHWYGLNASPIHIEIITATGQLLFDKQSGDMGSEFPLNFIRENGTYFIRVSDGTNQLIGKFLR